MGPPERGGDWVDEGAEGVHRFLARLWRLGVEVAERTGGRQPGSAGRPQGDARTLLVKAHWAIDKATRDFERGFQFNTVIAAVMELVNEAYRVKDGIFGDRPATPRCASRRRRAASLIFPFAPHLGAEVWEMIEGGRVWEQPWPLADPALLSHDTFTLVVQVNGKVRAKLEAPSGSDARRSCSRSRAATSASAAEIDGRDVVKEIVVPGRLVNIVVR